VSLTLALVYPIAILENESVEEVLKRSSALTRGHRLEILIAGLGLALVVGGIVLPFVFLMASAGWPPLEVIGGIVTDLLEQSFTVLSLVMYLSLIQLPGQGRSSLSILN
jgi:hypothetical protein